MEQAVEEEREGEQRDSGRQNVALPTVVSYMWTVSLLSGRRVRVGKSGVKSAKEAGGRVKSCV